MCSAHKGCVVYRDVSECLWLWGGGSGCDVTDHEWWGVMWHWAGAVVKAACLKVGDRGLEPTLNFKF